MKVLKNSSSYEMANTLRLGVAVGKYSMLKNVETALSDGTRHGSSECARQLRQLPQLKKQLASEIKDSLNELGVSVTLCPSNDQNIYIESFDIE